MQISLWISQAAIFVLRLFHIYLNYFDSQQNSQRSYFYPEPIDFPYFDGNPSRAL